MKANVIIDDISILYDGDKPETLDVDYRLSTSEGYQLSGSMEVKTTIIMDYSIRDIKNYVKRQLGL